MISGCAIQARVYLRFLIPPITVLLINFLTVINILISMSFIHFHDFTQVQSNRASFNEFLVVVTFYYNLWKTLQAFDMKCGNHLFTHSLLDVIRLIDNVFNGFSVLVKIYNIILVYFQLEAKKRRKNGFANLRR